MDSEENPKAASDLSRFKFEEFKQGMAFAVVKFINSNEVATVPTNWITNDFCAWPPKKLQSKVAPLIERGISPSDAWDKYAVKILGLFDTFQQAKQKLSIAEEYSDLNTTDIEDCGRGKRSKRPKRYSSSNSEEEYSEDLLAFPNLPLPAFPSSVTKVIEHPHVVRCPVNKVQDSQTELESSHMPAKDTTDSENFLDFLETSTVTGASSSKQNEKDPNSKQLDFLQTSRLCSPSSSQQTLVAQGPKQSDFLQTSWLCSPSSSQQTRVAQGPKQSGLGRLLLHELNIIKGQKKIIIESLNAIVGMNLGNTAPSCIVKDAKFSDLMNILPVASDDCLKQVEEILHNNETADKMVLYLSKIGGRCLESGVKNMLKRLLSDELASEYSYLGIRGKKVFKDLKICSIIKDAVNISVWNKKATEISIQSNNKKRKTC